MSARDPEPEKDLADSEEKFDRLEHFLGNKGRADRSPDGGGDAKAHDAASNKRNDMPGSAVSDWSGKESWNKASLDATGRSDIVGFAFPGKLGPTTGIVGQEISDADDSRGKGKAEGGSDPEEDRRASDPGDYDPAASLMVGGPTDVDSESISPDAKHRSPRSFNYNLYSTKKSAAQGLFDLALLMANASQLKLILMTDGNHRFYMVMLVCLCVSISLQVIVGLLLLWLSRMQLAEPEELLQAENDHADMVDAARRSGRMGGDEADDPGIRATFSKSDYPHVTLLRRQRRIDLVNNVVVAGIFVLTLVNVFISAFGLDEQFKPVTAY